MSGRFTAAIAGGIVLAGAAGCSSAGSLPGHFGLGWIINEASGVCGLGGQGPGASASLLAPIGTGKIRVALTNRPALIESVNALGLRS